MSLADMVPMLAAVARKPLRRHSISEVRQMRALRQLGLSTRHIAALVNTERACVVRFTSHPGNRPTPLSREDLEAAAEVAIRDAEERMNG